MKIYLAAIDSVKKVTWIATAKRLAVPPKPLPIMTSIMAHRKADTAKLIEVLRAIRSELPSPIVMMDSGAHTFHQRHARGEKVTLNEAQRHLEYYTEALQQLPQPPESVVELDLQPEVGIDQVWRWREEVWMPLARSLKCEVVYVWNPLEGATGADHLVKHKAVKYIGIASAESASHRDHGLAIFNYVLQAAHRAHKKSHLFGATEPALMFKLPAYSADSISWEQPMRWGTLALRHRTGLTEFANLKHSQRKDGTVIMRALRAGMTAEYFNHTSKDSMTERTVTSNAIALTIAAYWQLAQQVTTYWQAKGFDWQ